MVDASTGDMNRGWQLVPTKHPSSTTFRLNEVARRGWLLQGWDDFKLFTRRMNHRWEGYASASPGTSISRGRA